MVKKPLIGIVILCLASLTSTGCLGFGITRCSCEHIKSCNCGTAAAPVVQPAASPTPSN